MLALVWFSTVTAEVWIQGLGWHPDPSPEHSGQPSWALCLRGPISERRGLGGGPRCGCYLHRQAPLWTPALGTCGPPLPCPSTLPAPQLLPPFRLQPQPLEVLQGEWGGCLPLSTHAGLLNHPGSLPGPLVMCELVALGDEVHFRSSHEMFRKLLSCAGEW